MMFCSKERRICCIVKKHKKQNTFTNMCKFRMHNAAHWGELKLWTYLQSHESVEWHRERSRADDQTTETILPSVFTGEETNQLAVCVQAVGLGCTLIFTQDVIFHH